MVEVGPLIRKVRLERGLTQGALARLAATSQPAIARLEADAVSPSVATVDRVMRAIGLRLELLAREGDTGVDRTLIAQMLRLDPAGRLRKLRQEYESVERLRRAARSAT